VETNDSIGVVHEGQRMAPARTVARALMAALLSHSAASAPLAQPLSLELGLKGDRPGLVQGSLRLQPPFCSRLSWRSLGKAPPGEKVWLNSHLWDSHIRPGRCDHSKLGVSVTTALFRFFKSHNVFLRSYVDDDFHLLYDQSVLAALDLCHAGGLSYRTADHHSLLCCEAF
jgi:hypothetical protein